MSKMAPVNVRLNPIGFIVFVIIALCITFYIFGLPRWFREEERVSMREVLSASIVLARLGGDKVKEVAASHKLKPVEKSKTKEGLAELKTEGDTLSHRAIVYGFAKAYPGLKVISEEHDTAPVDLAVVPEVNKHLKEVEENVESDQSISMNQITVWIDPLDSTTEYTEELYEYVTTMVCVAVRGEPVIGVIHKPFKDETSWAWVGYGHSKNLVKAAERKDVKEKQIIISRSHTGAGERVVKKALGEDTKVIFAGGAGYKTLEVIKGNADAYVHVTAIKKWDICAGNAILSAVDGKMTTLDSQYIDYSPYQSPVNSKGLLASIYNHYQYLEKLSTVSEVLSQSDKKTKS